MDVSATSMAAKLSEDIKNPSSIMFSTSAEESPRPQIQTQTRSEHLSNPYPTTFVQADTSTFKQVVQMLTGSSETSGKHQEPPSLSSPVNNKGGFSIPPIKKTNSFKLYERRQNNNNNSNSNNNNSMFMINTLRVHSSSPRLMFQGNNHHHHSHSPRFSPRNSEILLSPSMLEFPKLRLNSPVTPLTNDDPFNKSSPFSLGNPSSCSSEEDRAIAEKGFYLHPSPISTPRDSEPQLLPLFPVTSPKLSPSDSHTD